MRWTAWCAATLALATAGAASAQTIPEVKEPGMEEPKAPKPAEKKEVEGGEKPSPWGALVGLALIQVAGNANAVSSKATATVTGRWAKWDAELDLLGAYGESTDENDVVTVTAYNGEVRLRGNRNLSEKFQVYLLGGAATDHVASIELRAFGEAGVGETWIELKTDDLVRLALRSDLGFRGTYERWYQYYPVGMNLPNRTLYSVRLAADFRYALSKTTVFTERAEVLPDLVQVADVRVRSLTAVSVQVVEGLSISLSFDLRYIGVPAENKRPLDTELAFGLSYAI